MEEFDIGITKDEDYQDAPNELFGVDQAVFGDIDEVEVDDIFDIDLAVEQLYAVIYEGAVNA